MVEAARAGELTLRDQNLACGRLAPSPFRSYPLLDHFAGSESETQPRWDSLLTISVFHAVASKPVDTDGAPSVGPSLPPLATDPCDEGRALGAGVPHERGRKTWRRRRLPSSMRQSQLVMSISGRSQTAEAGSQQQAQALRWRGVHFAALLQPAYGAPRSLLQDP